jgi:hypothetical protein
LGVVWTVQLLPFQRSAKGALGNPAPVVVAKPPAAVQAVAALHDTPVKVANVAPAGLGVVLIVQVVPFHCSANGLSAENAPVVE